MPATPIKGVAPSNKSFLRALLAAVIFMILSAVILVAGFLAWHYPQLAAGAGINSITLTSDYLFMAAGKGSRQDRNLTLNELTKDGIAIASFTHVRFNASKYPILEYQITGRNPGTAMALYWRTVTHDHQTLFAELHWNGDYPSAYNLKNHPEWKGKLTELGISITGDLRNKPISIEQLTFSPLTVKSLLLTIWSEWNAFQGWKQSSINVVKGMPANTLLSPVVAAAAWCGLAIILYSLWMFFFRTPESNCGHGGTPTKQKTLSPVGVAHTHSWGQPITHFSAFKQTWDIRVVVAMFLFAWLALDGKWQVNLWRQLADTRYLFAGKSHHEQHMAADDAELYAYAKRLKEEVLPKDPVRLFILRKKYRDFNQLRLMYYLLPHNIYNFDTRPNPNTLKNGDYILVVDPIKGLSYDTDDAILHYGRSRSMKAEILDESAVGTLFKVKSSNILLSALHINHRWNNRVLFGRLFNKPIIITGTPSYNGADPGVTALGKDKNGNLQLRFQEWDYLDNSHSIEQVPVLALEQGIHHMPDGSVWETGTIGIHKTGVLQSIMFKHNFSAPPSLFLTPQTSSIQTAISVHADNVKSTGFVLIANTQESRKHLSESATLGYLAIYAPSHQGSLSIEEKQVSYHLKQASISSKWQSFKGFDLRLQEEQSLDKETAHSLETVNILVINDHVFAQTVSNKEPDTTSIRMREHKNQK